MSATLTAAQIERYREDGILFPVPALTPGEAMRFRDAFDEVIARLGGRPASQDLSQMHLYFPWAYELVTHPTILDAVEAILGPDILVWALSIFAKYPRDPGYVSWHQDGTYWGLDSSQVTTAWVALTDSMIENGCMRVVPGSHTRPILPHKDTYAQDNLLSRGQEVQADVDEEDAVGPRYGFAIRFTTPKTKQIDGEPPTAVLARGRDDYHHFHLLSAPPALSIDAAIAAQQAEARRLLTALRATTGHYAAGGA